MPMPRNYIFTFPVIPNQVWFIEHFPCILVEKFANFHDFTALLGKPLDKRKLNFNYCNNEMNDEANSA